MRIQHNLEGENITFTCPTGAILTGPNMSTCVENEEWEPDPREVECNVLVTTTRKLKVAGCCLSTSVSVLVVLIL